MDSIPQPEPRFGSSPQIRPACETEAESIAEMRDAHARWQQGMGIRQWTPGEIPVQTLRRQIIRGEWQVLAAGDRLIAAVRLVWADPDVWDDLVAPDDSTAGYVHGLMVAPALLGQGVGGRMLDWAESRMLERGRRVSRLDCVESNQVLRAYYRGRGYTERGVRRFTADWEPVMRFERALPEG